jgi:PAB-dependent poly(A)-specific ribonuclease subunit 2
MRTCECFVYPALQNLLISVLRSFNSVGMPYYRDQLLSSLPSHMISEVGAPPPRIDPQTLSTMTVTEWGGYARNTRTTRRNQVENTRTIDKSSTSLQAPKFLSEKARESAGTPSMERRISDAADALGAAELSSLKAEVPVMYRNVEIKYSKFGVDDFDFGYVVTLSLPVSC